MRLNVRRISSVAELREVIGSPSAQVEKKIADRIHDIVRPFIEKASLVLIATASAEGSCDVSPRGDPAGFVRILDESTLLIPDRKGNKLADTLRNIVDNGQVGLIFIVPGVSDTFRVNGRAFITDDAELLAPSAVEGRAPALGIVVEVEQAYTQCSKAFLRSDFWNTDRFVDRGTLPTAGEILSALTSGSIDGNSYDVERDGRYARREGFY